MNHTIEATPGTGDPSTFTHDNKAAAGAQPLGASEHATLPGETTYRKMECFKGPNKESVGYLSDRFSNSAAVGTGDDYPASMCYWFEKNGAMYLAKKTSPNDRCLGLGDSGYASWALQQARNMGYFTNIIRNPDGTLSPGIAPETYLAGPYNKYGVDWVWWAPKGHPDILVCELVDE